MWRSIAVGFVLVCGLVEIAMAQDTAAMKIVTRDYDGDGKADFAVRLRQGIWLLDYAKNGLGSWDKRVKERSPGGKPAEACPADYDGDGKVDIAILLKSKELCIDYAKNGFGRWDVIRSYNIPDLQTTPAASKPSQVAKSSTTPPGFGSSNPSSRNSKPGFGQSNPSLGSSKRAQAVTRGGSSRSSRSRRRAYTSRAERRRQLERMRNQRLNRIRGGNPARGVDDVFQKLDEAFKKSGLGGFTGGRFPRSNPATTSNGKVGGPITIIVNGRDLEVELLALNHSVEGYRRVVNGIKQSVQVRIGLNQRVRLVVNGVDNNVKIPSTLTQHVNSKVNGKGNRVRFFTPKRRP